MAIFGGGPPILKRIQYFNLSFCHHHLLTKTNICAKFERNRWFELYHLLPGSAWFSHGHTLKQLERRSLKKSGLSAGFEPVTSAIPVLLQVQPKRMSWWLNLVESRHELLKWNPICDLHPEARRRACLTFFLGIPTIIWFIYVKVIVNFSICHGMA